MIIKSVHLTNFRNHSSYTLDCKDQTSLILGENGCGKTSVLEAIYILTRGKSFRATDSEIIKRGSKFYRIELEYSSGEKTVATFDGKTKTFLTLDKKTKRLPARSKYPVVLFLPSDLNLISHAPSRRRDYFDYIFSELDENYSTALSRYKKALRQRAEILKYPEVKSDSVFSWNILLAKYGALLARSRARLISQITSAFEPTYHSIAENSDQVTIDYLSEANGYSENDYLKKLESNFSRDVVLGHTSFGVHRDDYLFKFNNKPANGSASRGETRSLILSLKFVEASLLETELKKKPLILLDDVFSELDMKRRQCLVQNFKNHQVIITSVEDVDV